VQRIVLEVERRDDGRVRFTSTQMPGWAAVARTPLEIARVLTTAWTEAEIAAYARWRGTEYDLDDRTRTGRPDPQEPPPRPRTARGRRDVHSLEAWTPLSGGAWRSPSGQVWGSQTQLARKLTSRARAAGLPHNP
jgi:hypothetical protein